ncbi:MAG TPA: sensor histidine kinase [Phnomibacter sp.]|nr:sensor histidine kinase [Phnomibacter sp.]
MKKYFLLFGMAFVWPVCTLLAQGPTPNDSLRSKIQTATTDSLKVEALYEYMKANLNNNTSDFEPYVNQMIGLSTKIKFKWGLSTAYILALVYNKNHGDFYKALNYADSAIAVTKNDTAKNMRTNMGHVHLNRGNLYYNIGEFETAMQDYFEAEKYFKQTAHKSIASVYTGIANCFMGIDNHPKALEFSHKAVSAAESLGDNRLLATNLMNLATEYMNVNDYERADSLLKIAWPLVDKLQNSKSFFVYYYNKGDVEAYHKKDTAKALQYYQRSLDYATENEDISQQGRALEALIDFQLEIKQAAAKPNIDKLYAIAVENEYRDLKASAYGYYADWYSNAGEYKKAFEWQKKEKELGDSLRSDEIREKTSMMEVRFRVNQKEQEIAQLKAKQEIQQLTIRQKSIANYILIGGALAVVIISLLGYRSYRHKQKFQQAKIDEFETEKQLMVTEAMLKGEEQERARLAKDLHDGLGGMLSGIKFSLSNMKGNLIMTPENALAFERSVDMLDSSIKEMRHVAHNMMPEVLLKYGLDTALADFCNEIKSSGVIAISYQSIHLKDLNLPQTTAIAVYRIVQELVANAMKHAAAESLLVQAAWEAATNKITLTIEDDGKGFDAASLQAAAGIGWKNIYNRVEFLKGNIHIDSKPGTGTSVLIEVPNV